MRTLQEFCQSVTERSGSDLHLTVGSCPRIRQDGRLQLLSDVPLSREEIQCMVEELLTPQQQLELSAVKELDCSMTLEHIGRFRCHVYQQQGAIALALRVIPRQPPSFEELALPPVLAELIDRPQGLVLVVGPTGSGKSTTLSAMIDEINSRRAAHIVTIEDPIEFSYVPKKALITQREIGEDARDFSSALKGVLRQDPDVVCLGELRDFDTIHSALTIAETGHLTLATVHTNSAVQTINRLIAAHPPHQHDEVRAQLSMVLAGIISQRLVPNAGGKGRVLAVEVMIPTPAIRNLIREDKIHQIYSIMQTGQAKHGMQTMNQALADLCRQGLITSQVAIASTPQPEELMRILDRNRGERGATRLTHVRLR
ncbi:MAG: type IV pilus twitching motility protein PilT [Nitrospirales bacterium]|nr:type IV pilus twitching motility protein PilT [Nitrospira sp.]MDR4500448.1 type IV pilus twitching motility protein PilT [Nitrospirales bacterium]